MAQTYTRAQIAEKYGLSPGYVRNWLADEGIGRIGLDQQTGEALYAAEVVDRVRAEMPGKGRSRKKWINQLAARMRRDGEAGRTIRHGADIDNAEHDS